MIGFLNYLIKGFATIVTSLLGLLPQTPFAWNLGSLGPYWAYANYFIPFGLIAGILATYLVAVLAWYAMRWILRFVRYIN